MRLDTHPVLRCVVGSSVALVNNFCALSILAVCSRDSRQSASECLNYSARLWLPDARAYPELLQTREERIIGHPVIQSISFIAR